MRTFSGATRSLRFALTIASVRSLRSRLGIDLLKPSGLHQGTPLIAALSTDIELFTDVLHDLCSQDTPLDAEAFATELSAPDAFRAAREAFFEEWIDFFLRCGQEAAAAELQKQIQGIQAAMTAAFHKIAALDVATAARTRIESLDFEAMVGRSMPGN